MCVLTMSDTNYNIYTDKPVIVHAQTSQKKTRSV